jgi:hypothetical protein
MIRVEKIRAEMKFLETLPSFRGARVTREPGIPQLACVRPHVEIPGLALSGQPGMTAEDGLP